MKSFSLLSLFFVSLASLMNIHSSMAKPIGTVNMNEVFNGIEEGKIFNEKMQNMVKSKEDELKKMKEKIMDAQKEFESKQAIWDQKAKTAKMQEMQKMEMDIQQQYMLFQQEIAQNKDKMMNPIQERVKIVVEEVSKTEDVSRTFALDLAPIYDSEGKKDLTDAVVKKYNEKYTVAKVKK